MWREYRKALWGEAGEIHNTDGFGPGAAILSAIFMAEVAGSLPWAHLDIAGAGWVKQPRCLYRAGTAGAATITLIPLTLAGRVGARE